MSLFFFARLDRGLEHTHARVFEFQTIVFD